jgi:wobble nucleotide-excising tRNase
MLRKLVSIKNVGRFQNYGASGDVELKHYNLIFGENGRGKTTLCATLRSVQSGEAAYVLGRKTLGSAEAPDIKLLMAAGPISFTAGSWTTTVPEFCIFDSTFVSENVFSGDEVDIDHKRSLYRVIVGKQGVELALKIEEIDAASRAKNTEIKEKAAVAQSHAPKGIALDIFQNLSEEPAIDQKIAAKEKELESIKQADQIKTRATLSSVKLPSFPAGLEILLDKSIDEIGADAEKRVADQIKAHVMHKSGERWLSEGLGYVTDACPFCSQPLENASALIAAIRLTSVSHMMICAARSARSAARLKRRSAIETSPHWRRRSIRTQPAWNSGRVLAISRRLKVLPEQRRRCGHYAFRRLLFWIEKPQPHWKSSL